MTINFTNYILLGFLIAILPLFKCPKIAISIFIGYWLILLLWSLQLISPFNFYDFHWVGSLGINFSFETDGLTNLFVLLVSGIGMIVFRYAKFYFAENQQKQNKLLALLQCFAISMLGIISTDNLIILFIFWELTTVFSYLLIQFDIEDASANQAALISIFISVLGALIMLVGFILLNNQSGSWNIQANLNAILQQPNNPWVTISFICLFIGAITKSAQFPFHFWLPGAMKAPTPVSAYLHSATMVNAGIYLLARFYPGLHENNLWYPLLASAGLSTMFLSAILSLRQYDLKALLAYTTLFVLGSMVYLLSSDQWLAIEAFCVLLLFHAVYKAGTFMAVGILDKQYRSRDLRNLFGVAKHQKYLILVLLILFGSMAGLPPFFGFVVKEMLYEAKLAPGGFSELTFFVSTISSILIAACSLRCLYWLLIKGNQKNFIPLKVDSLFYPGIFCITILLMSLFPGTVENYIFQASSTIISPKQFLYISPNQVLGIGLSISTVLLGLILAIILSKKSWFTSKEFHWPKASQLFLQHLQQQLAIGKFLTRYTQEQSLNNQLRIIFSSFIFFLSYFFLTSKVALPLLNIQINTVYIFLAILLLVPAITLLIAQRLVILLIALSIIGLTMTSFFILKGAPDVAMTQLLVEILTVIILLIALRNSDFKYFKAIHQYKILNASIAIGFAFATWIILTKALALPFNASISHFYLNNSYGLAFGKNVVNVVLVDFRALDTLGEVLVVLGIAICIWQFQKKYIE